MEKIILATLMCLVPVGFGFAQQRTVTPLEYGQYYGYPPNDGQTGILVLNAHAGTFAQLPATSIKAPHGHFQHFAPAAPDDDFPYQALKNVEAQQIAAGGPPIFVTATYAGKSRPVYFYLSLGLDANNHPTTDPSLWAQAVNLRDDTFIQFFANNYVQQTMFQNPALQNYWLAVDNCMFWVEDYGVIDDNGVFQYVTGFDPPFALNDEDFLDSIIYFLNTLKQIAPGIHLIGNEGTMSDESRFAEVWAGFAGTIREDIINGCDPNPWLRDDVYLAYTRYQWEGPAGKAALLRALIPNDSTFQDKLRTAYVAYLVFRGPNFFFGPRYSSASAQGVPISAYSGMKDALGTPVAAASDQNYGGTNSHPGYRLYSRQTSKGIVYLNWSGRTLTIPLPGGRAYVDRNGKTVTSLTIPDLRGDYVLFE